MPTSAADPLRGLRGERIVSPSAEAAAQLLAVRLADHLRQRLTLVRAAHLALSGGSSTKLLASALITESSLAALDWSRIHVWLVDERCVPADDPRLNANLVREALVAHLPLPAINFHPMPVQESQGAAHYEAELRAAFADRPVAEDRQLDAVVLGMGADGHTASLFPNSPALEEHDRLIALNDGDRVTVPRPRMTMTYPLINGARFIALLVTGASKRAALGRVASSPFDFRTLPVTGIGPAPGASLLWCLDRDAASAAHQTPGDTSPTTLSG
jgi:6-phosphogluconolactonase